MTRIVLDPVPLVLGIYAYVGELLSRTAEKREDDAADPRQATAVAQLAEYQLAFERQETEQEVTPPPQPVPVPESVPTTEPNVIRRQQPNEAAPRQAEQASKLSKQSRPSEMKISQQLIEAPAASAEVLVRIAFSFVL